MSLRDPKNTTPVTDYFLIAEELIEGEPLDIPSLSEVRNIMVALSSLRNESIVINAPKQRIEKINSLISKLDSLLPIPQGKSIQKSKNTKKRSKNTSKNKKSLTQEQFDEINQIIDDGLSTGKIKPKDDEHKQHILFCLNQRKTIEIDNANYYEVEKIDDVINYLHQPPKVPPENDRIQQLLKQYQESQDRYEQLVANKENDIAMLLEQKEQELQDLAEAQKEELREFCEKLPQYDSDRVKLSHKLLVMREDEKNYSRGGDYSGAMRLHQIADALEGQERLEALKQINHSCDLKRQKEENRQTLQRNALMQQWDQKIDKLASLYDEKMRVEKLRQDGIQSTIVLIKKKLGLRITSIEPTNATTI